MDLTTPLSSVIPTLEAQALTVLVRSRAPLSGLRIAQLASTGSRSGIKLGLDRLVASGLVRAEQHGSAIMYTLNRDHVLADGVISMAAATARLRQRLRDRLAGWDVPCVHASLFGSAARGDGETHSDIDVLVVKPADVAGDDPTWQGQLAQLEEDVARWTGNTLSLFETTTGDLLAAAQRHEPVVQSWREDAIQLAGEPLASLLRAEVSA